MPGNVLRTLDGDLPNNFEVGSNVFPILQMKIVILMLGGLVVTLDGASLEPVVCIGSK